MLFWKEGDTKVGQLVKALTTSTEYYAKMSYEGKDETLLLAITKHTNFFRNGCHPSYFFAMLCYAMNVRTIRQYIGFLFHKYLQYRTISIANIMELILSALLDQEGHSHFISTQAFIS